MQYRFPIRLLPLMLAAVITVTGCRNVSEEIPPTLTEIQASTAEITVEDTPSAESVSETVGSTAETSETAIETTETEITETEQTTAAEKPTETTQEMTEKKEETETETKETTAEITTAIPKTTAVPETATEETTTETVLTLQSESPPETSVQTAAETESAAAYYGTNSYNALNFREQKGFWITYLEYASIMKNKSESSFRKSVGTYFDNISDLGFNTVYVQVRAFGDAYYDSDLYPSGEQFDGTIGTSNDFDALQVMIDCAHNRGMSIHAWINPMRLMYTSQLEGIDDSYQIKKWYDSDKYNGTYIVKSGDRWYLNPAYSEVTDLIASGITEIAANYDVDGIQIDDYFYPTTDASFDKSAYSASETDLSLSDWRISNVNKMVKKLYKAAHNANSSIVFGISPQGSVDNNYNQLYADVKTWCKSDGYCDYILPQVYFGFHNATLPYEDVIALWSSMVKSDDVKLVIGLAAYKIGAEDTYAGSSGKNEWLNNDDIISRQMALAKTLSNYGGVAIYRYDSLFNPSSSVAAQVDKEIKNIEK
ncbi:MAG: family 10 glycosylhydrolase [Oscillospiraceae bacterium]|nr:family 10 glycosylhydrolase [Oscillospiraceae bacterium]